MSNEMKLNKYIDHTILKPGASVEDVKKICDEAKEYGFASVCVNPANIAFVAEALKNTGVNPCVVVGFPLGATLPEVKAFEAETCIGLGAKEVDMVVNIGAIKSGDWDLVKRDIAAVVKAAKDKALVKVIIETCLLTDDEKIQVCKTAKSVGADFVKTSTGFSTGGAVKSDIELMRRVVGNEMGVKASGGVRSYDDAVTMINAGATRLGTSSGVSIVNGEKSDSAY